MRFISGGPSIPDDLLNSRDDGRVVFFCGAGVSRAKVGLPDFNGLANSVLKQLGVTDDSDASTLLQKINQDSSGLIATDRVFGYLEREFDYEDIQIAVARSLNPGAEPDLTAHKTLLRLATTPQLRTQLVTTNFDLLFNDCSSSLQHFQSPKLPNPSNPSELDGITYLHGRVTPDYSGAESEGFVLSSSTFGKAYLADGWATDFVREIIRNYTVVFVGYGADDPPISYLLEGLGLSQRSLHHIYTFQAGFSASTTAKWQQKGVTTICYETEEGDGHFALWKTLDLWAERADDPIKWRQDVIKKSIEGPAHLEPYQRGQVAHIVSSRLGAKDFDSINPSPEWLCVFDPNCRYTNPLNSPFSEFQSDQLDPYTRYCLDSDMPPQKSDSEISAGERQIPTDAWNAFVENESDIRHADEQRTVFRKVIDDNYFTSMPDRLSFIGSWISRSLENPITVWWAIEKRHVHPSITGLISNAVRFSNEELEAEYRNAWNYILESWSNAERAVLDSYGIPDRWFFLERQIRRHGWSAAFIRSFVSMCRPFLTVRRMYGATTPPSVDDDFTVEGSVRLEVNFPSLHNIPDIGDEWLSMLLRGLRANLEYSVQLLSETDSYKLSHLIPIVPDERPGVGAYGRGESLAWQLLFYVELFKRLCAIDILAAKRESLAWSTEDESIFCQLQIWAASDPELFSPEECVSVFESISDTAFWRRDLQRDLLITLKSRWATLPDVAIRDLEKRLEEGPPKWDGEDDHEFLKRKTRASANRLTWLANHGCTLSSNLEEEISEWRLVVSEWEPEFSESAADSIESQSGSVTTDTDCSDLMDIPISSIISKARELAGHSPRSILKELDPFAGLCNQHPKRAYLALESEANAGSFPIYHWIQFLTNSVWENDNTDLVTAISQRLCELPDDVLEKLFSPVTIWFMRVSFRLYGESPDEFYRLLDRFLVILRLNSPELYRSIGRSNRGRDWISEGKTSHIGHIIAGLRLAASKVEGIQNLPSVLTYFDELLRLDGDFRLYALSILSESLAYLYSRFPLWTELSILSVLDSGSDKEKKSIWQGFFSDFRITKSLFLRIKRQVLSLSQDDLTEGFMRAQLVTNLAWGYWGAQLNDEELLTNEEFRKIVLRGGDKFRKELLWQLTPQTNEEWAQTKEAVIKFFNDVWPRQKEAKNHISSNLMFSMLMSNGQRFADLYDTLLPLMAKLSPGNSQYLNINTTIQEIVNDHPQHLLTLLHRVLPDDARGWPHGTIDLLTKMKENNPSVSENGMFRELEWRWISK